MDRVRDLVAAGGVSVVLAQDRDRFSREPAYTYLLRREFEEHGCELRSLNDRGDGSPEGDLTDGILDQLAKYERAKIAERSQEGEAQEGQRGPRRRPDSQVRIPLQRGPRRAPHPRAGDGGGGEDIPHGRGGPRSEQDTESCSTRRHTRHHGAGECGTGGYCARSYRATITGRSPTRRYRSWWRRRLLARLDRTKRYGVQWYNRDKARNAHRLRARRQRRPALQEAQDASQAPREEWLAIPVPASDRLPRDLVDLARADNGRQQGLRAQAPGPRVGARGVMRCSCGSKIKTKTTMPEGRGPYHYYMCMRRFELRGMCSCTQKAIRAADVEEAIWEFVSRLLKDPERIRLGMERLIERGASGSEQGRPGEAPLRRGLKSWPSACG